MNDELEKLLAEATPGPWRYFNNAEACGVNGPFGSDVAHCHGFDDRRSRTEVQANAALIVAAVNALPELLARVRENEYLTSALHASENETAMWQGKCERLGERIKPLEIALGELAEAFDEHVVLPEGGCNCHVNPPCSYCTNYGFAFHARQSARAALNQEPGQ